MDVAKYVAIMAVVLFCFYKTYDCGVHEGRCQGFLTALHEFTTGCIAIEGDELVFNGDTPFTFHDPKTGEQLRRMKLDELEFKSA